MSTNNLCSEQKYEEHVKFSSENFTFFGSTISSIFELARFRNVVVYTNRRWVYIYSISFSNYSLFIVGTVD